MTTSDVFTVRNPATNSFELFLADGTTPPNVDAFVAGNVTRCCSSIKCKGEFSTSEVIRVLFQD